jgi:hypothetical protein
VFSFFASTPCRPAKQARISTCDSIFRQVRRQAQVHRFVVVTKTKNEKRERERERERWEWGVGRWGVVAGLPPLRRVNGLVGFLEIKIIISTSKLRI